MPARLILYHVPLCGFCQRIRSAAQWLRVDVELVDINRDDEAKQLLLDTLGRTTVPVLRIDSSEGTKLLAETRSILDYFQTYAISDANRVAS
jgi:glutathione S-transferase